MLYIGAMFGTFFFLLCGQLRLNSLRSQQVISEILTPIGMMNGIQSTGNTEEHHETIQSGYPVSRSVPTVRTNRTQTCRRAGTLSSPKAVVVEHRASRNTKRQLSNGCRTQGFQKYEAALPTTTSNIMAEIQSRLKFKARDACCVANEIQLYFLKWHRLSLLHDTLMCRADGVREFCCAPCSLLCIGPETASVLSVCTS